MEPDDTRGVSPENGGCPGGRGVSPEDPRRTVLDGEITQGRAELRNQ